MSTRPTSADRLAAAAAHTDVRAVPDAVRRRLSAVVADVMATAAAGAGRAELLRVRTAMATGDGPATVIGRDRGADPATAALLNAMPVASEQLQDGHRRARGHPGSHVVPAVLAVAEATGAEGTQALSAILAGYEVGVRVGIAMGGTPAGVHDIATWGSVGAAAAVAHLLSGGDATTVAAAIDLAGSAPVLAEAATVFDGADGQHVFLGLGAQLGVLWAQSAAAGLRPRPGALDRHFAGLAGAAYDPAVAAAAVDEEGSWRSWELCEGYLKRHPTCAHLHGVNDAAEDLLTRHGPVGGAVAEVDVATYAAAASFDEPNPGNELAARFSIPYTVAVALVTGQLDRGSFTPRLLADPTVRSLAARVRVRPDPRLDAGYPHGRPAEVTVRLHDGSVLSAGAERPRGDGPGALDNEAVRDKPRRIITETWDAATAEAVLTAVDRLSTDGPASAVLAPLRTCGG